MPRYLIERTFGNITDEDLQKGGSTSKHTANERFPEIVWEHSHAVQSDDGLKTFCVYTAPNEQYVRDHAAAAGLPVDRMYVINADVGPDDFD